MMKIWLRSLLCLCFANGAVIGDEVVSCRFVCLEGVTPPQALVVVSEKGEEVSCTVPMGSVSPPFACFAKENTISFLSSSDQKLVATATLPPKIKAAILIFSPAPKDQNVVSWKVSFIDDSLKNFMDGGVLLANYCAHDIRFTIGSNTLTLHSGESRSLARPTGRDAFNMAAAASQYQKGETWINSSESMLRFLPGMRYLMFAYPDSASGNPRVVTLQDIKPSVPAKR